MADVGTSEETIDAEHPGRLATARALEASELLQTVFDGLPAAFRAFDSAIDDVHRIRDEIFSERAGLQRYVIQQVNDSLHVSRGELNTIQRRVAERLAQLGKLERIAVRAEEAVAAAEQRAAEVVGPVLKRVADVERRQGPLTDAVADLDSRVVSLRDAMQTHVDRSMTQLMEISEELTSSTNAMRRSLTAVARGGPGRVKVSKDGATVGERHGIDFVAGTNVTVTAVEQANLDRVQVTIASTGGGGAGATNLGYAAAPTDGTVTSDTGTDAIVPVADGTNAGLMAPAQVTKLAGIETGATADQTAAEILTAIKTVDGAGSGLDADLLDGISSAGFDAAGAAAAAQAAAVQRANHTGTQPSSTISDAGLVKIAETVLGANAASVVFSSIPSGYSALLVVGTVRQTKAAATAAFNIRLNNDSGANYTSIGTYIPAGSVPGATATAGRAAGVVIWFPGYAQTTFHKTALWQVAYDNVISASAYGWNNTAAVNEIDLLADTNNFLAGSAFRLYGVV